jgi:hypothetical protein
MNASTPVVTNELAQFMQTAGLRLVGWDPDRVGICLQWRREPLAQGDSVRYEFATNVAAESHFTADLADALYFAGVAAGREELRTELKALLFANERKRH